jgi:DNA-binding transcriptional LysR family regulator
MPRAQPDWEGRIGRRIKLRDLHILSAVVRWGSMAKAASHLAMSQSAVSEAIAGLEAALKVRLLDRNAQGIEPTIYTDALLRRGQVVFDELREGIKDIEFLANPEAGEVRIACPEFLSAELLPRAIDGFSRRYPHVVFNVVQSDSTTLDHRELKERAVDLSLSRMPRTFVDDDLNVEVLLADPHFIIAGEASRWAKRRSIKVAELIDEQWVLPPAPMICSLLEAEFKANGLKMPAVTVNASSLLLRNQMLATGRFLSVMPQSLLGYNAKRWHLKRLPVDLDFKSPPISAVTLKRRTLSPVVQLFMEHLRKAAKTLAAQPIGKK